MGKNDLMLPNHIQMVMLSATIDSERFTSWAEKEGSNMIFGIYNKRIPLTHYGYLTANEGAIKLVKDKQTERYSKKHS